MNPESHENEESHLGEMIAAADIDTSQPDREFLAGLKTKSTRRFCETASSAKMDKRNLIMAKIKKFAPGALAACLIGAIGVAVLLWFNGESSIAWADVQKHIEQAKCMTTKVVVTMPDGTKSHGQQTTATGDVCEGRPGDKGNDHDNELRQGGHADPRQNQ
jgi:hypothetical protein